MTITSEELHYVDLPANWSSLDANNITCLSADSTGIRIPVADEGTSGVQTGIVINSACAHKICVSISETDGLGLISIYGVTTEPTLIDTMSITSAAELCIELSAIAYDSLLLVVEATSGTSITLADVQVQEECNIYTQVADVISAQDYYPGGSVLPGRSFQGSEAYRYGFNGMEKDDEVKGNNNSYDFGARIYDPRLMRWMSVDPLQKKYPSVSPYQFVNNSPLILIDPNGKEWVNAYRAEADRLGKQALDNPNDKKIARMARRMGRKADQVDNMIQELRENDPDLYNYIDNLTVKSLDGKSTKKVKVYVHVGKPENMSLRELKADPNSKNANTRYNKVPAGTPPNVQYGDKEIVMPSSETSPNPSFDVYINNGDGAWADVYLANEAGDVMYYMEYNERALEGGGDLGKTTDEYVQDDSAGDYSTRVEEEYKENKKNPRSSGNPYPLKLRSETKKSE